MFLHGVSTTKRQINRQYRGCQFLRIPPKELWMLHWPFRSLLSCANWTEMYWHCLKASPRFWNGLPLVRSLRCEPGEWCWSLSDARLLLYFPFSVYGLCENSLLFLNGIYWCSWPHSITDSVLGRWAWLGNFLESLVYECPNSKWVFSYRKPGRNSPRMQFTVRDVTAIQRLATIVAIMIAVAFLVLCLVHKAAKLVPKLIG